MVLAATGGAVGTIAGAVVAAGGGGVGAAAGPDVGAGDGAAGLHAAPKNAAARMKTATLFLMSECRTLTLDQGGVNGRRG